MDLKKFLPGQENKEEKDYYWSLVIEPGWVAAGVWRIYDGKAQVISIGTSASWELDEELVASVDTALTSAVSDFPEDVEAPSKTVFGVISSWVVDGKIKDSYLEKIKKVCTELSLKPVGFVVLSEAIANLYKSEDGSPPNAVIMGLGKDTLELSVFRLGNLLGTAEVARSVSIVEDVTEGISRFASGEPLPSRFILYDGREGELEEVRQELIKANWDELDKLKFLHTPKVEIVTPDRKINAVSLAGASEIADTHILEVAQHIPKTPELSPADLESADNLKDPDGELLAEDLGFVIDEDISNKEVGSSQPVPEVPEASVNANPPDANTKQLDVNPGEVVKPKQKLSFAFLSTFFGNLKNRMKLKRPEVARKPLPFVFANRTLLVGLVFFVLILVGGFAFWWFYPKATVVVYVSTKKQDDKMIITVDPSVSEVDVNNRVLPGKVLKTSVAGDKTKSATGTKTVGDAAKGEITLYRVGTALTLPAGSAVKGSQDLGFTLNEAVQIASGSASTPGTVKAKVTAGDIGSQYNLAANTNFSVSNYSTSDIEAKNESDFSGGSSREITAISAEDQKSLQEDLLEELSDKAKEQLAGEIADNDYFIEESLIASASSKTFSGKVGDEASSVKLEMNLAASGLTIDKNTMTQLAVKSLADNVPNGFVLRDEQIDVTFEYKGEVGGKYEFDAFVSANLLPDVDPEVIAKKIVGKYQAVVEDYLVREIPGFVRAEMKFNKPRFPGRLGTLPRVLTNIEVEVAAEK